MISSLFKGGGNMVFGAVGIGMFLGGCAGTYAVYKRELPTSNIEHWNKLWKEYRSKFPYKAPFWEYKEKQDSLLNNEYLELLVPTIPKVSSPSQVKSIRVFVPLCGSTQDMEIINDFVKNKVIELTPNEQTADQYKIKIMGIDSSIDAIQLFLDKLDIKEKDINKFAINYPQEYNIAQSNEIAEYQYKIDNDIFSKIPTYRHNNFHLIHCDIFDASTPRLVLRADAIYDNQALSSIDPSERKHYMYLMKNIVTKKSKIILVTDRFDVDDRDEEQQDFPPYPVGDKDEIFKLYKDIVKTERNNIKLLDSVKWGKDKLKKFGFPEDYQHAYSDIWYIEAQK